MGAIVISQYLHRPNVTELGLGNTHETYLLVNSHFDLSKIFPPAVEVSVIDQRSGKSYPLKSAFGSEFRINQMGAIYRDYNVAPGDEITFTAIERSGNTSIFFCVSNFNRVTLWATKNGVEVTNIEKLEPYRVGERKYKISIENRGNTSSVEIEFKEAKKKRTDSPNETDYYNVTIDGVQLNNGMSYLTIGQKSTLSDLEKSTFNTVEVEEDGYNTMRGTTQVNKDFEIELQTIFFGSPGTGKSFKIKDEILKGVDENYIFRTTFHPDTDYSSFVGCYKPTTEDFSKETEQNILDYDSLVEKLKEYLEVKPTNITRACTLFGFDYHDSIVRMLENNSHTIPGLIEAAYKPNTTYDSVMRGGMAAFESSRNHNTNIASIAYKFTPQAFTNAYIKAWQNPTENVYLVIEEINRGNCAQIFGDLFQLLDRDDNGVSEYPIKAEADLTKYLQDELGTDNEGIANGKIKLPANFYILATMNTSDQSLFPMDSAFKRRWEWQYIPTSITGDKKKILRVESKEGKVIINRDLEQKVLKLGMYQYDWSLFLEKINKCITEATHSDDKQLGFWFVKTPKDSNEIKIETFVSKVIFYLWTDVFKDFGAKATNPFAFKNAEGGWVVCPFSSFFDSHTGDINLGQIHGFMYNLGVIPELEPDAANAAE